MTSKRFISAEASALMQAGKYKELKIWIDYWIKRNDDDAFSWVEKCADHGSAFGMYSYARALALVPERREAIFKPGKYYTYEKFRQYEQHLLKLLVVVAYNSILYAYIHECSAMPAIKFAVFRNKIQYWLTNSFARYTIYRSVVPLIDKAIVWLNGKPANGSWDGERFMESRQLLFRDYCWAVHCDVTMMGGMFVTDRTDTEVQRAAQIESFFQDNYPEIKATILKGIKEIFVKKMNATTLKKLVESKKTLHCSWVHTIISKLPKIRHYYVPKPLLTSVGMFNTNPKTMSPEPALGDIKKLSEQLSTITDSVEEYEKKELVFDVYLKFTDRLYTYYFIRYVLNNKKILEKYLLDTVLFDNLAECTMQFIYGVAIDIIMTSIVCNDMSILQKFKDVFCQKIWKYYFQRDSRAAALLNKSSYKSIVSCVALNMLSFHTGKCDAVNTGNRQGQPCIWVAGVDWIGANSWCNYSTVLAFDNPSDAVKEEYKKACKRYNINIMRLLVLNYVNSKFLRFTTFKALFESADPLDMKRLQNSVIAWKQKAKKS